MEANKIREQTNEAQLKIKELEHNISKHKKESQDAAAKVFIHSPSLSAKVPPPRPASYAIQPLNKNTRQRRLLAT